MLLEPEDSRPGMKPLQLHRGLFITEEMRIKGDTGRMLGILMVRYSQESAPVTIDEVMVKDILNGEQL